MTRLEIMAKVYMNAPSQPTKAEVPLIRAEEPVPQQVYCHSDPGIDWDAELKDFHDPSERTVLGTVGEIAVVGILGTFALVGGVFSR